MTKMLRAASKHTGDKKMFWMTGECINGQGNTGMRRKCPE
jgi:hypothetical protein